MSEQEDWPTDFDWRTLMRLLERDYPEVSLNQKADWIKLVKAWLRGAIRHRDVALSEECRDD